MLTRFSLILILSVSAFAQITGVRFDDIAYKQAGAGIATVGNPVVTVCTVGSTTANCALNKVLTYTDGTLATPCPSNAQVTLTQTSVCVATGDTQGNFGFWLPAGNYSYMIAGSGAATKMYTLTLGGNGAGGVTISGAVTPGHIATIVDSLTLQDGGTGGSGNSTTPIGSGQIAGASGTFLSNSIRYVNATDYMWTQSPSDDLSASGAKTITLTPCPLGVAGADTWNYVHIGTIGTPEDVQITGGTCVAGAASGTITVTTANTHGAGYTVASSTQGWQEASNDARFTPTSGSIQSGHVVGSPGEYTWTATMTVHAVNQTLDFSGTIIGCNMSASCYLVGSTSNAFISQNTHTYNFRGRPMVTGGTYAMIEDNGQASVFDGVYTRNGLSGAYFGTDIQVDNDQAASISHVDPSLGSPNIRCDATFCGAVITAPGPFSSYAAVGYIHDSNLTLNCSYNGIDWQSGNTLHVSDTVVQGYAQFGIRTGIIRGGFGPTLLDNVYEEAGACTNPLGKIGQAGVIAAGQNITIHGGEGPVGNFPVFNTQGGTQRNYYVVMHDTTAGGIVSTPLPIGTGTPTSGTITLTWPQIAGVGTVTYDVLATSGAPSATNPVAPNGTANQAVDGAVGISGSCSAGVCTATDTFATPLDSYAVAAVTNFPYLTYWPGGLVLSAGAIAFEDKTVGYTISTSVNGVSVFAYRCSNVVQLQDLWSSCIGGDPVGTNSRTAATVFDASTDNSGTGLTGRLDFATNRANIIGPNHFITLVDSNPLLTLAAASMRRAYSPSDTYLGTDTTGFQFAANTALAIGNPVAITNYINSNPDNSSWLERLTSSLKTFKVHIVIPTGTPASSSAACTTGTIEWDSSYVYVCVSTNAWERAGIATW